MNANSQAITLLCSHLCADDCQPLEPAEWSALASLLLEKGCRPEDFLRFEETDLTERLELDAQTRERYLRLLDRVAALEFALTEYENMGIRVLTRADKGYPQALRQKLKNSCPPLFYVAGELSLLDRKLAGYVGSRSVSEDDAGFTERCVEKTAKNGYGVVSGGAKGVDQISAETALKMGVPVVEYPSDSLLKKLRVTETIRAVQDGRLLMLSAAKPDAGFQVGIAMMRNRYIYVQSQGTVVIRADYNKGGTWAGATDCLKHDWCPVFCRDCANPGNQALIRKGAAAIDENWDGDLSRVPKQEQAEQLSLF